MLRAVMDTNVLYSALRSNRGASFQVFSALLAGKWRAVVSNHLLHEYEEILKLGASLLKLNLREIDALLDELSRSAERLTLPPVWTPVLRDADDEPLVQLAIESRSFLIITHNVRDLLPARRLGVAALRPGEFLEMLNAL